MNKTISNHFISIIVPVYNNQKTLGFCLESIFNSSFQNFECIVVDDHSTDSTLSIAESFDTRIVRSDRQKGAAHARNLGADIADGDVLLFIDADVKIYPDTVEKVSKIFTDRPEIAAVFGSYDDRPGSMNFCSQYKNLFHHYIHQTSKEEASTFWSGCGAIKKKVFLEVGKFNDQIRMMEDIELGYRLKTSNYKILLWKDLLVKHLKHYSFFKLIKSDLFDRAVPWTLLILNNRKLDNDLNLKAHYKLSPIIIVVLIFAPVMLLKSIWYIFSIPILLSLFLLLNLDFYTFFLKNRGFVFTVKVIPLHILYYLYSSLGFVLGFFQYIYKRIFLRHTYPSLEKNELFSSVKMKNSNKYR